MTQMCGLLHERNWHRASGAAPEKFAQMTWTPPPSSTQLQRSLLPMRMTPRTDMKWVGLGTSKTESQAPYSS
ncbi:hypothetical protein BDQ17DRAFT_1368288 [Cyathus striatus]|nr:hypothetical protein BDQ17DRAFT_1368288 [Cyathus striatus]